VGIRRLLLDWFRPLPFDVCPECGGAARDHQVRTLARERFSPGVSGIEALLARREFARAAALDDPGTMGDRLVHQVVRCGDRVVVVTVAEPAGLGLDAHVRGTLILEGADADAAWRCARFH
jgi:hypothetical protein